MVAGYLFSALTQQHHGLLGRHRLQAFLFLVLAIYFVWFWSHGGQTVAMKAWHIRLINAQGMPISQKQALARYLLSWLWFVPALVILYACNVHSSTIIFSVLFIGVLAYALSAIWHPARQFPHDVICGTQLILDRPIKN